MNITQPAVLSRYGARLLDLWLGAIVAALLLDGATLSTLTRGAFLLTLVVLTAKWLITVLNGYADTGDIPDVPPAAIAGELLTVEAHPPITIHNHVHLQPEPPPPPPALVGLHGEGT